MFLQLVIWTARVAFMVAVSLTTGALGSLAVRSSALQWYASLNKPFLSPPAWVYGVVWTVLYILMGIAAGLIWNIPVFLSKVRAALLVFLLQLILNIAWVVLFFGFRLVGWALAEILILWVVIILMEYLFYTQSKLAGILLWPCLAWVTFAIYLNAGFVVLNR